MMQKIQMIFDPIDGKALGPDCQLPKDAAEYREVVKNLTWRYNPWTGAKRLHAEMEADTQGVLICPWVSLAAAPAAPGVRPGVPELLEGMASTYRERNKVLRRQL
jgi:hypothetical protein